MFRKWGTAVVAAAMIVSGTTAAFAGTDAQRGALAPGGSAGVKQAQMWNNHTLLIVLGLGIVVGGVALVASNGGNGHPSTTTTGNP